MACATAFVVKLSAGPVSGARRVCICCIRVSCACRAVNCCARVPFSRTRWRTFSMPSKSIMSSAAKAASAFAGAKKPSW